tara:strand:+ start:87 stop:1346 length:1260 start_codon:yes stop_codon:yes gene_type:complete
MSKKKIIFIITIVFIVLFFGIAIFIFDKAVNTPKYQNKISSVITNKFFYLPDIIKSSVMILSGRRSFSNLFNDYNIKFLPETQYINLNFERKKIDYKKLNRNSFYIDVYKENLIITRKNNEFYNIKLSELEKEDKKIEFTKYKINEAFNTKRFIFDSLILNNHIYVTTRTKYEDCEKFEIYFAKIEKRFNFKIFKSFDECITIGTGTSRIEAFKFNNKDGLLVTTHDADNDQPGVKPQNDNSIFGKILFIDIKTKEFEIFSKGHRNAQGLFVKDNIVLSTEHGPRGGDEINKIEFKKNYGWPIVSYGKSYKKDIKYLKSHKDSGFEEPLYAFVPSIGISQLIVLPDTFNSEWQTSALVTSLNGRTIYRVKFEDKTFNKIIYIEEIYIGERIRDIKYVDKLNFIVVALERTGDIGILKNY